MTTKIEIRKSILEQRSALSKEELVEKSTSIFERLCTLKQYNKAKIVLVYMDYRNEVMTGEFIRRCRSDGKRVALPKVEPGIGGVALSVSEKALSVHGNALSVYEIHDADRDIITGFKGIPEPNSAILNKLNPIEIDLAVIPGVAFDCNRQRVGYGAGYYDQFLTGLKPDCLKVGVAYSLQLVDKIPVGKHDMPMDLVITEDKIIEDIMNLKG